MHGLKPSQPDHEEEQAEAPLTVKKRRARPYPSDFHSLNKPRVALEQLLFHRAPFGIEN